MSSQYLIVSGPFYRVKLANIYLGEESLKALRYYMYEGEVNEEHVTLFYLIG